MTLTMLGIVICPLMNLLVLSGKINSKSEEEYKSIQIAQNYMEEIKAIKAIDEIDTDVYLYNAEKKCYERIITDTDNYVAEIRIRRGNYGLYYIEVDILYNGELINSLAGSIVF